MDDPDILTCLRGLLAEEHRLKVRRVQVRTTNPAEESEIEDRLAEIAADVREMCELLRRHQAGAKVIDLTQGAALSA